MAYGHPPPLNGLTTLYHMYGEVSTILRTCTFGPLTRAGESLLDYLSPEASERLFRQRGPIGA